MYRIFALLFPILAAFILMSASVSALMLYENEKSGKFYVRYRIGLENENVN